jgi:hypothetical protein
MRSDDIKAVSKLISRMDEELGEDCDWEEVTSPDRSRNFVRELENELPAKDFSALGVLSAAAKCTSRDDVLFSMTDGRWRIYHLTYSKNNAAGFPRYREFSDFSAVAEYFIGMNHE